MGEVKIENHPQTNGDYFKSMARLWVRKVRECTYRTYVSDTCSVVMYSVAFRRVGATSRNRCDWPSWSRSRAVGLLAIHLINLFVRFFAAFVLSVFRVASAHV